MKIEEAIKLLNVNSFDNKLTELYVDSNRIPQEKERYLKAIDSYRAYFGEGEIEIFSAPGRSEIGGNHTDHQHGEVLAASINNDAIAVVKKLEEPFVKVMSDGYSNLITIRLDDLEKKIEEEGSTNALIRGVLAKMKMNGHLIGGFQAYVTSEVLIGAGLSSSAAFETLIGTILSYMYNDGEVTPIEIAKIGQYAENIYFGKPCGLMDQMACSVGSLVHIDFADPENPIVEQVDFDMNAYGYSLCITDTKGSHADLTPDYAAIPQEMKQAAAVIHDKGCQNVILKAGDRLPGTDAVELVYDGKTFTEKRHPKIPNSYNHGAGCTFSAAVTACLAKGMAITDALETAENFIYAALRGSFRMNQWSGALKHCAWRE